MDSKRKFDVGGKVVDFDNPPKDLTLGNLEDLERLGLFKLNEGLKIETTVDLRNMVLWGCRLFNPAITVEDVQNILFQDLQSISMEVNKFVVDHLSAPVVEVDENQRPT